MFTRSLRFRAFYNSSSEEETLSIFIWRYRYENDRTRD